MKMEKMIENINNLVKTDSRYRKGNIPGVAQCKANSFALVMAGGADITTLGIFVSGKGEPFTALGSKYKVYV